MQSFADAFRDGETARKTVKLIEELAGDSKKYRIVHVCGTHEDTITKYGIRTMLPENVEVLMGPGCPVCTVPPNRIDYAIGLAEQGYTVTTYGDMMRVPSGLGSLQDAKARGHDVRIVYSIHDAVKMAEKTDNQVVHFAVGFETTAPTTGAGRRPTGQLQRLQRPPPHTSRHDGVDGDGGRPGGRLHRPRPRIHHHR